MPTQALFTQQTRSGGGALCRVGLLVFPAFSMLALSAASEPLRAANRLSNKRLYECTLLSPAGTCVDSSSGLTLSTISIDRAPRIDRLFVVASLDIEKLRDISVNRFLQATAVTETVLGALSTGAFVLARAGLLSGYRCTLHWESLREFAEEFPEIQASRELYVRDRNRWTCAGGTAAMDLMLAQIATDHGGQLAADVAEQFLHSRIRGPQEQQRMAIQWRYGVHDARIVAAIACMEQHLEQLVPIEEVAVRASVSERQLERLWHQHFGLSPQRFYLDVRLQEVRRLLKESMESIASIALRCGFGSSSHMSAAYRKAFGRSPSEERQKSDRR